MRTTSKILLAAAALAGTGLVAVPASARTYVAVGFGVPVYRGYGYRPYYPAYYAPPVVYGGWYGPHYYGRPWGGYYHRGYYRRHWR